LNRSKVEIFGKTSLGKYQEALPMKKSKFIDEQSAFITQNEVQLR